MVKVAAWSGPLAVLVLVKANLVEVSIFLAVDVSFACVVFDSAYGVGFCCCSCGFQGLAIVLPKILHGPYICPARNGMSMLRVAL